MTLSRVCFIALLAVAALLGTATHANAQLSKGPPATTPRDTTTSEYLGAYQRGFEQSWFLPCEGTADDNTWWVTLTDDALAQRDSILSTITAPTTDGLAVRWRATLGPRMPAGHMGHGTRYMLVTKILEMRPLPKSGACGIKS
ncbi:MAG: hypothetical protein ABJE10_11380 [bacterium]